MHFFGFLFSLCVWSSLLRDLVGECLLYFVGRELCFPSLTRFSALTLSLYLCHESCRRFGTPSASGRCVWVGRAKRAAAGDQEPFRPPRPPPPPRPDVLFFFWAPVGSVWAASRSHGVGGNEDADGCYYGGALPPWTHGGDAMRRLTRPVVACPAKGGCVGWGTVRRLLVIAGWHASKYVSSPSASRR